MSVKDKCDLLNQGFASVFTKDGGILPSFPSRIPDKPLDFIDISYNTVLKYLQTLPSSCTLSPDGFPALFLKSIAPSIALPLSILFMQSLRNGQIPKIWKVASVRPLFKKGLCSLPSNYRPISLTSVIGKVMEKLVNRVTDLGVVFASDLKSSVQCSHIAAKAFGRLSLLMKCFLTSDVSILLQNLCLSHTGVQLSCLESLAYF